jgi:type II secretory pathway component PulJ
MIDLGLRGATLDIAYVASADDPADLAELETLIRTLKNELDVNVEPASPGDFLPVPRSVLERSRYVGRQGRLETYYDHLPTQVIAKVARGLEQDFNDAERLITAGEVTWPDVEATWQEIKASRTGWLRYEPEEIEQRLKLLRQRLDAGST